MNISNRCIIKNVIPILTIKSIRSKSQWALIHHYNVLKSRPNSTQEEIRENFILMSKIYHPDNPETGNQNKFVRLRQSYELIKCAPLMLTGEYTEDSMTHADFIKTRKVNPLEHKTQRYTINEKLLYRK